MNNETNNSYENTPIQKTVKVLSGTTSYAFKLLFALIGGIVLSVIVAFITELIFDSDKVPSGYTEVVLDKPIEFDNKIKEFGLNLYNNPENCIIKFKKERDGTPVVIDLSSILFYKACFSTTKCVGTISGEQYAIKPGNSFNMDKDKLHFHIEECGKSRNKGDLK